MEILIRAKQSDNAMFDFLAFDDPLQPFFRHMVVMIKAGRFTVGPQKQGESLRGMARDETRRDDGESRDNENGKGRAVNGKICQNMLNHSMDLNSGYQGCYSAIRGLLSVTMMLLFCYRRRGGR